jgi:hypothetical protein
VTLPARWTADERERRALLEQGVAVAVNMRRHGNLIAWAKERRLFARVDRATPWGNPFVLGREGDRATVIARYATTFCHPGPTCVHASGSCAAGRSGAGALRRRATRTCSPLRWSAGGSSNALRWASSAASD